jgi:hypothetical protein
MISRARALGDPDLEPAREPNRTPRDDWSLERPTRT